MRDNAGTHGRKYNTVEGIEKASARKMEKYTRKKNREEEERKGEKKTSSQKAS